MYICMYVCTVVCMCGRIPTLYTLYSYITLCICICTKFTCIQIRIVYAINCTDVYAMSWVATVPPRPARKSAEPRLAATTKSWHRVLLLLSFLILLLLLLLLLLNCYSCCSCSRDSKHHQCQYCCWYWYLL